MPHFKKFTLPLFSFGFTILSLTRTLISNPLGSLLDVWFALAFGLIFSGYLILFICIDLTCKLLDRYYIWENHFKWRLFLQLGAGCALPLLLLIMLCFPIFNFLGVSRLDNYYNFPGLLRSFIATCCTNIFYITIQYYLLFGKGLRMAENRGADSNMSENTTGQSSENKMYRKHFEVPDGSSSRMISVDEIAYLYRKGQDMFLITNSGSAHPFWQPLDAVEEELDPVKFFRAYPGAIVAFAAIDSFEEHPGAGLTVHLKVKTHEPIKVSREKRKVVSGKIETYMTSVRL